jgi:hypothetical protein
MPAALHTHTEAVSVCVEFEYIPCQRSELLTQYIYEKNPSISFIKPRQSYLRYKDISMHCVCAGQWFGDTFIKHTVPLIMQYLIHTVEN